LSMNTATLIRRPTTRGIDRRSAERSYDTASSARNRPAFQREETADPPTTDDQVQWDDRDFEQAPRSVLRRVSLNALRDPSQRGPWTEKLFPLMLEGTPARRRLVYETLREFADPQDILINSLVVYLRYGDAEPLAIGAGLLEDLGAMSWPVLAAYARTVRPECADFVPAIARLNAVAPEERLLSLEILAHSDDADLRWSVYEALDEFPVDRTIPVLRALAEGGRAEDSVKFAAEVRLRTDVEV
jgi:hypothetical protein